MADMNSPGAKKGSPMIAVLIVGMVVIAALLGVIAFLLLGRNGGEQSLQPLRDDIPNQRAVIVNEENAEEVIRELAEQPATPMGYYEVSMNFSWTFPDGTSPSDNAYVENVVNNEGDVYFDVLLAEDESVVLYESPILPPGTHIDNLTLAQDLDVGTYPCVIVYHLVDEQQVTYSTLRMGMEIIVNG